MTEDDTKVIAYIRRRSKISNVAKISTFKAGAATVKIYDYGMEAGDERYFVTAESSTKYEDSIHSYKRLETALEFISWDKLWS